MLRDCKPKATSSFRDMVIAAVQRIPPGRLASYGQVARAIGKARAARAVGTVLGSLEPDDDLTPWHRVVNREGGISPRSDPFSSRDPAQEQAQRLALEGVDPGSDGRYCLKLFGCSDNEMRL